MATKLDRIRAKVLEYDDYDNAINQFWKLKPANRSLALTDDTLFSYLRRASKYSGTTDGIGLRMLINGKSDLTNMRRIKDALDHLDHFFASGAEELDDVDYARGELGAVLESLEAQ